MKIKLERNPRASLIEVTGRRACPRSLSVKRELRRSGGKPDIPSGAAPLGRSPPFRRQKILT